MDKGRSVGSGLSISVASIELRDQATPTFAPSEEIEPRIIGTTGTTVVGFARYVDKFFSSNPSQPSFVRAHAGAQRGGGPKGLGGRSTVV